jgi:subtilisin family serine protease
MRPARIGIHISNRVRAPRAHAFFTRAVCALVLFTLAGPTLSVREASAETPLRELSERNLERLTRSLLNPGARYPIRVEGPDAARALGAIPISPSFAVVRGDVERLLEIEAQGYFPQLGPARRPLLDQAQYHNFLPEARDDYGLDGSGVFVGIVDTGVSASHPAMRRADGSTRIAWLLSFDRAPLGLHPDLERAYGCDDGSCAILAAEDIDVALASGAGSTLPTDTIGHGTHVASTAAGRDANYPGIAPGADLLVVQSGNGGTALADGDILLGTKFIMDRASEAERPVVVNLSLGSNFGSHDGKSPLELGLAELAATPGHLIVVASGNEGSVYSLSGSTLPEPLGPHTEAAVLEGGETHVALATAFKSRANLAAYAWIAHPGDALEIAFQSAAKRSAFVGPNDILSVTSAELGDRGSYEIAILNGKGMESFGDIPSDQAVFVMSGEVQGGEGYELVFRGRGTVELWLESTVALDDGTTFPQAVFFPRARTSGTVAIPASHPDLIAVGASINRTSWTDYTGTTIAADGGVEGGLATFSSAGPNGLGHMKPDLLAPGDNLIAAMSAQADPRLPDSNSQFRALGRCPEPSTECLVVDDTHALSSGTSMSAPQVTGAVALLLEREPSLTEAEARSLLRAGARAALDEGYPGNWYGAGELDIRRSLIAQDRRTQGTPYVPSAKKTRLALGNTFAYPDPTRSVRAFLLLRDESDLPAGGFPLTELEFKVSLGTAKVVSFDMGILELELSAPAGSGGETLKLDVLYRGDALASAELPVGVDPTAAILGYDVSGGCSYAGGKPTQAAVWLMVLVALGLGARARPRPKALNSLRA